MTILPEGEDPNEIENTGGEGEDLSAALDSISSELFGQESGIETGDQSKPVGESEKPTPTEEPAPQTTEQPKIEENSQQVQETGAPKTWSKEAIESWATIPPRAQQEILKREADMFKGLEQYREKADLGGRYDAVAQPYREALTAENVDPVTLFQSFAANHYTLVRGKPEEKVSLAHLLLDSYGIPLEAVQGYRAHIGYASQQQGQQPNGGGIDPALAARIHALETGLQTQQARENEARKAEFRQQVDTFAADPKNIYFAEVANDIVNLIKTGAATSLPQAYDMAIYTNPAVRQKEIDRLTAETLASREEAAKQVQAKSSKAQGANLKTKPKSADGTVPVGSMDETLNETFGKIQGRA